MEMLNKLLTDPLKDFIRMIAEFLPHLFSAIIVFLIGLLCGRILKGALEKTLRILKADNFFKRVGISPALEKGGIKDTPSVFISKAGYWLIVAVFFTIALYTLNVPAIDVLLQKLLLYLPNIFIAVLIIVLGFLLSSFVETAVLIASVNAGIKFAKLISYCVRFIIVLIASTMALEQLGIGHDTVLVAFALIFGGMIFTLSLAFGLAGKEIALKYLDKKFTDDAEKDNGIQHL
jgi:hypothetical protein